MTRGECYTEEWRAIEGFEGRYFVSSYGRVKSYSGSIRKLTPNKQGYLTVTLKSLGGSEERTETQYKIHRLVWSMFIGDIPSGYVIDHINRDKSNNSIYNLRLASFADNTHNVKKTNKKCSSKFKGVCKNSGVRASRKPWRADICNCNKRIALGDFDTEVQAAIAYDLKSLEIYGKFACTNLIHTADSLLHKEAIRL